MPKYNFSSKNTIPTYLSKKAKINKMDPIKKINQLNVIVLKKNDTKLK